MRISDWSSDVCSSDLHTPPPLEAECDELHETIRILLATLGYPVFQPLARSEVVEQPDEVFHCRASEADARGLYTEEGFVVLAGSSGDRKSVVEGKGVSVSVDLGCRRIINKKKMLVQQ